MEYLERVKKVHQTGGYGSTGYIVFNFGIMITIIIGIIVSGSWKKLKRTFLEPIQQLLVLVCCINWANRYIFMSMLHSYIPISLSERVPASQIFFY